MLKEKIMIDLIDFKNWLSLNCGSKASAKTHLNNLRDYFRHNEIYNQDSVNSFLVSKREIWQSTTFNMYLNSFKWYARFLKIELEFPKFRKINVNFHEYISEKELDDILIKLPLIFENPKKVQTILKLMFEAGTRPKEIINIKRKDFNFDTKTIILRDTKTYTDREVPLSDKTSKMIQDYFSFEAEKDNAFNISFYTLNYIFNQINKCLNLKKKLSPYMMRRSFAHNLYDKNAELSDIQKTMGHGRIETTFVYLNNSTKKAISNVRAILNKKKRR